MDRISGTIPGLDHLALQTDHFKINKFGRLDDPSYLSVLNCIIGFAEQAVDLVQSRSRGSYLIKPILSHVMTVSSSCEKQKPQRLALSKV